MNNQDKSFAGLFADLARETRDLVQQEVQLAKAELSEKITQVNHGLTSLITGGVVAFAGVLVLLWALVAGVAQLIEPWTTQPWVAPLIVGLVVSVIGLIVLQRGKHNLEPGSLAPNRTRHAMHDDARFIKEQFK